MLSLPAIFKDEQSYQHVFINGLKQMLKSNELGVFILVLANATYDKNIYSLFSEELEQKFNYFADLFKSHDDHSLLGAIDDVIVFKQLMTIGFENCGLNQVRKEGEWLLQYNPLRSLRPARNSHTTVTNINQKFDANSFNFNKSFLVKEELWQGIIGGKHCRLLYNKFPFADFHSLLVIDSDANKNQWIKEDDIGFLWIFAQSIKKLTSLQIAYNSMGAFASINHQHFQLSICDNAVIEKQKWTHNRGAKHYPLNTIIADDKEHAWLIINDLQTRNIAFNFLFKQGVMYIIPRLKQGEYEHSYWTTGFAWSELFGLFSISNEVDYLAITHVDLEQELKKLKL